MANFTIEERTQLVKNCKAIFDYLRTEIAPYIRRQICFKMEVNPREYDLVVSIFPTKNNPFMVYRNHLDSTKYTVGYDYVERKNARNFFECYDEMFCLIENWKQFKLICLNHVEHEKDVLNKFEL